MLKTIAIIVLAFIFLAVISYVTMRVVTAPHTSPSPHPSGSVVDNPTTTPITSASAVPFASSASEQQTIKVYLVALEDQGKSGPKIGCGDSIIAVDRTVTKTPAVLKATLDELLSLKKENYQQAGLYSAFYNSDLKTESAVIVNGKATVKLTGVLSIGGVCDNPRVQEQLTQTIKQFPTVKEAEIFINNKPITELLSEKG